MDDGRADLQVCPADYRSWSVRCFFWSEEQDEQKNWAFRIERIHPSKPDKRL